MDQILRKHYIATFISALLLVGAALLFMRFAAGMKNREQHVVEIRDRVASFELNKQALVEESVRLEEIKSRIESLEQYVVTKDTIPTLLSDLEDRAKSYNIAFDISTANTTRFGEKEKLSIEFVGEGTLFNVEAFLQSLLSQTYQVRFTRFNLHRLETTNTTVNPDGTEKVIASPITKWRVIAGIEVVSY